MEKLGFTDNENLKKWTTQEILQDVRDVCYQIRELENKPRLSERQKETLKDLFNEMDLIKKSFEAFLK